MSDGFQDPPNADTGEDVGNPDIQALSWPRFLENLALRVGLLCLASALMPVSLGVIWFTNIPRWQLFIISGSSGTSTLVIALILIKARRGRWTKKAIDIVVEKQAEALTEALEQSSPLTNPYTYQKPY